jgi:hypothetical protein
VKDGIRLGIKNIMELGTDDGILFSIKNGIWMGSDDSNKLGVQMAYFVSLPFFACCDIPYFCTYKCLQIP